MSAERNLKVQCISGRVPLPLELFISLRVSNRNAAVPSAACLFGIEPSGTHPVLTDVMPLHAGPLQAEPPLSAAGAIGPREVACLAHEAAPSLPRTPQLGAVLHVGAGLRANAKSQLTLLIEVVVGSR